MFGPITVQERVDVAGAVAGQAALAAAGAKDITVVDLLPNWDGETKQQSPEEMIAVMRSSIRPKE